MKWNWQTGAVAEDWEHMLLLYGDADKLDPKQFLPMARVAPSTGETLTVQFLVDDTPANSEIMAAVRQELEFMLEQVEPDPWRYAMYHCGTAANWYSLVHWAHLIPTKPDKPRGGHNMHGISEWDVNFALHPLFKHSRDFMLIFQDSELHRYLDRHLRIVTALRSPSKRPPPPISTSFAAASGWRRPGPRTGWTVSSPSPAG